MLPISFTVRMVLWWLRKTKRINQRVWWSKIHLGRCYLSFIREKPPSGQSAMELGLQWWWAFLNFLPCAHRFSWAQAQWPAGSSCLLWSLCLRSSWLVQSSSITEWWRPLCSSEASVHQKYSILAFHGMCFWVLLAVRQAHLLPSRLFYLFRLRWSAS